MNGCRSADVPFAPCRPTRDVTLLLPRGEEAVSYDISYEKPVILSGKYSVSAFRPGGRISAKPPQNYYRRRSEVYTINAFFPYSVKSERFFTHNKNGHSIFMAAIHPVQYNPVSGEIRYYSKISVSVNTTPAKMRAVYKCSPFIKSWLADMVDNPEAVLSLPFSSRGPDDYEYLIVTMSSLENDFNEFIAFNTRRCLRTKLVTINEVLVTMSGSDNAEKLKNYIKQEYEDHNIVYVLLGGDEEYGNSNYIPHKGYYADFKDYGTDYCIDSDIAADMYYECLDGDGLDDLGWEVYAARFAVDDASELQNIISKTIKYSEQPVTNAATKALLAGERAWENINGGMIWGKQQMLQLVGECAANGYITNGLDGNFSLIKLFEEDANWSKADLINQINANVAWINHIGHSNNFMVMKMRSPNDMASLTNTSYFIAYSQSCYSGAWDNRKISFNGSINTGHYAQDCIAEGFTAETGNGAVAYIGNSRYSLGDNGIASQDGSDGSSQRFHRYFHEAVFGQKFHHLAMMQAYSKEVNKQQILDIDINSAPYFGQMSYACYSLNVLGDPALSIWTKTPGTLVPVYDTVLTLPLFTMQTPPYTWVALLGNDSIICTQLTGADGNCVIDDGALAAYMTANPYGMMKVNIKAHNYLPYQGNLHINFGNGVMLLSPNYGELWGRGNTFDITWADNISENLKIELLKGGSLHSTITPSTPSTSPYAWTIPDTTTTGSDYKIKITSVDSPSITDASYSNFSIVVPSITVSSPNGGNTFYIGDTANIVWNSIGNPGAVNIHYTINGGSSWSSIVNNTENDGFHLWIVPNVVSDSCKIRVFEAIDGTPVDESDDLFTIAVVPQITLTSPNGGEKLLLGSVYNITWSDTGTVGSVKIEYTVNGGSTWTTIIASTINDGMHPWTVVGANSSNCKIRVSEASDSWPVDESDNVFTIEPQPSLTVLSPNGGEALYIGTPVNITWQSAGTVGPVNIVYSPDDGSNWYTVVSGTANDGIHPWTVPDLISINCKIRISEAADDDPADEGNAVFAIVPQPTITIISPNGGELLKAGTVHDISWTATGTVGNVKIEYSADNGTLWGMVAENTANDGVNAWTVPVTASAVCKIRVSEAADWDPFDESDTVFSIDNTVSTNDTDDVTGVGFAGSFTVVPNPVRKNHKVKFLITPLSDITHGTLKVYDPLGNILYVADISYCKANEQNTIGSWNLRSSAGKPIPEGSYLAIIKIVDVDSRNEVLKTIMGVKNK